MALKIERNCNESKKKLALVKRLIHSDWYVVHTKTFSHRNSPFIIIFFFAHLVNFLYTSNKSQRIFTQHTTLSMQFRSFCTADKYDTFIHFAPQKS